MSNTEGLRCLRCCSLGIVPTGTDPTKHFCPKCGQVYTIVLSMIPVGEPLPKLLEEHVRPSTGTTVGCGVSDKNC